MQTMGCRGVLPWWARRARGFGVAVVVVLGGAELIGATPAYAAGTPATVVCTLSGTASFSPGVTFTSTSPGIGVSITTSGTCVSTETITTNVSFTANSLMTLTCEGGEGSLGVNIGFTSTLPPSTSGTASVVAGPANLSLVLATTSVSADAELAWTSPLSTIACAAGGVTSVPVAGAITVVYS
jgi:hypothetical protein